jgi:fructokinase
MIDIVSLGEILIDMFPSEIGRKMVDVSAFRPKPGGAPANVAVAAARFGAKSAFIGKVGADIFGCYLEQVLQHEGVDTCGLRFDTATRTTLVFIAMPDEHTAEFVFYRNPGADTQLKPDELDRSLLERAACLHFGSVSLSEEPARCATIEAVRLASASGALISFDVNYRPTLWRNPSHARRYALAILPSVNLVKLNEVELTLLTGESDLEKASQALLEQGPDACVITLGPQGSFFRTAQGCGYVPAFKVFTVDATGCGDAFIAALICQLVIGKQWKQQLSPTQMEKNLIWANAAGALTATAHGVIPALPYASQVVDFLRQHAYPWSKS